MANVVEIAIRGIDEATRVFRDIEGNADRAFNSIESSIDAIPDIDIDAHVDGAQAESSIQGIEDAADEAESAVEDIPDPDIDGNPAEKELDDVSNSASEAEKSINKISFKSVVKDFVLGAGKIVAALGVFKLISSGMNMIRSSFEGAVSRVDTLQQFPRVLQQMGYGADEASRATEKLSDGIQGLPTRLNDITSTTQRLVNVFQDVDKASDSAIAMNNAFLASSASSEDAARGMDQYVKMLSTGKVELDAWTTLQETMPYALQKTAEAFGYTGRSAQQDLYSALQEGHITLDEFNDKIIELSEEQGGFAEVALEASKGINTSWTNIETAVTNGVANAIQAFDDWLNSAGFGGIADILDKIKDRVSDFFSTVAETIPKVMDFFYNLYSTVSDSKAWNTLGEAVQLVIGVIGELWAKFTESSALEVAKSALQSIADAILSIDFTKIIEGIVSFTDKWTPLIAGVLAGITAFKAYNGAITLWTHITSIAAGVGKAFGAVMAFITSPIGIVVIAIGALVAIIVLLWRNWDTVSQFLADTWEWIKTTAEAVWGALKVFFAEVWEGIKNIFFEVVNWLKEFLISSWNFIKDVTSTIWNAIKEFFSFVWQGIVAVVTGYINVVQTIITTVFNIISNIITTIWNTIKNVTSTVWNTIVSAVSNFINRLLRDIRNTFNGMKRIISNIWNTVRSVTSSVWGAISGAVKGIIDGMSSTISRVFGGIKDTISNIWNGIKDATSSIWDGIVQAVKAPINTIIGLVNGMINALNSISIDIPKVPDWVPGIGGKGGGSIGFNIPNIPQLATGGVVSKPTLAIVGDAGRGNPEIVAPQKMLGQLIGQELRKYFGHLDFARQVENNDYRPLEIVVPIYLDGKQIAKVTAPYMDRELGTRRNRRNRAEGG